MATIKKCLVCGKEYQAKANSKTCSPECKKLLPTIAQQKHNTGGLLEHESQKARDMGLTYGQYKARQYLFRQKVKEVANEEK